MANQCVEYKLHRNEKGQVVTPGWIVDPGYYYHPNDKTYIGFLPENPEWYVPDYIVVLSQEKFVQRGMAIHKKYPELQGGSSDATKISNKDFRATLNQFYKEKTE